MNVVVDDVDVVIMLLCCGCSSFVVVNDVDVFILFLLMWMLLCCGC